MKVKQCPKCKQIKPVTEFNRRTDAIDGKQSYCRDCQHKYPVERKKYIDGKFEVMVLPGDIKCYRLKDAPKGENSHDAPGE